jgi:multidrug efflux pump subunit AcrA (membrane-fusion protein)
MLVAAAVVFYALNAVYGFTASSSSAASAQLTATAKRGIVQSSVSATGNVTEATSASANFATSGTITAVYASIGEHVKAGQALAKIDPTSARNTLTSAEANLATATSQLASAESGLTAAQRYANTVSLLQAKQTLATDEQQLSADKTALATAKAQLASDAKLGFPPSSATSSGSSTTGSGSSTTGSGSSTTGSGSSTTGSGSSTGTGSSGTGSSGGAGSGGTGSSPPSGSASAAVASAANATLDASTGSTGATSTPAAGPTVATGSASVVSTSTATLNGTVNPGGLDTTYYFEYGTSPTSLSSTTASADAGSGSGPVPVSVPVSGLAPGQSYYFALVATNSAGTNDGSLALFAATAATPVATTGQASSIGSTTATLGGTVNPGALVTTDYFEYGTSATNLSSRTATFNDGSGSGSVSRTSTLHGLKPNTTYEFRLVATNSSGTSTGVQQTFTTTAASKPVVVTGSASGALTSSVTLSGSVNPAGTDTKYWFEYGTTSKYGAKTRVVDAGSGTTAAAVSATVTGLRPNTTYLFRVVARNGFGTSIGLGQVAPTAASSRSADEQAVTTAEQTVQRQEATVATAQASLAETEATIAASETPSTATIAQDQATVAANEATIASDQQALGETTLRAPIAGTVTASTATVGATASGSGSSITAADASTSSSSTSGSGSSTPASSSSSSSSSGSALFTIKSLRQLEIVAGFAEADATKIAVGQPATITFPALTNTEVAGRVSAVSLTSTTVSNVVTYYETIVLINPPSTVKEGMTADVSVVDQTATNALYVPSAAVTTGGTSSTVEVLHNGKTTVTRVVTGLVGNSDTQIVSGLKAGDVVVEPTASVTSTGAGSSSAAGAGGASGFPGGGFPGGGGLGGGGLGG